MYKVLVGFTILSSNLCYPFDYDLNYLDIWREGKRSYKLTSNSSRRIKENLNSLKSFFHDKLFASKTNIVCEGGNTIYNDREIYYEDCEAVFNIPFSFQILRKRAHYHGPNCWNNALVTSKVLQTRRFSRGKEMEFWLNSPLCQEIAIGRDAQAGDIIAVKNRQNRHIHSVVYISKDLAFEKKSYFKSDLPDFVAGYKENGKYSVAPECQNTTYQGSLISNCDRWSKTYRCQSWNDFINNISYSLEAYLRTKLELIDQVEEEISSAIYNKINEGRLSDNSYSKLLKLIQEAKINKEVKGNRFLWNSIYQRGLSIKAQHHRDFKQ